MSDTSWKAKVERLIEACDGSRTKAGALIGATNAEVYSWSLGTQLPPTSVQQSIDKVLLRIERTGSVTVQPSSTATAVVPKKPAPDAKPPKGGGFRPKDCDTCGKSFTPSGPRAVTCPRCKTAPPKRRADSTTRAVAKAAPKPRAVARRASAPVEIAEEAPESIRLSELTGMLSRLRPTASAASRAAELLTNIARDSGELADLLGMPA